MIVQLDDYANERGAHLGQVLSIAPGLSCILPASGSFRRPASDEKFKRSLHQVPAPVTNLGHDAVHE
jgi:hypothetical protein